MCLVCPFCFQMCACVFVFWFLVFGFGVFMKRAGKSCGMDEKQSSKLTRVGALGVTDFDRVV